MSKLDDYRLERIQEEVRELNRETPGRDEIYHRLDRIGSQLWWNYAILLFIGVVVGLILILVGVASAK